MQMTPPTSLTTCGLMADPATTWSPCTPALARSRWEGTDSAIADAGEWGVDGGPGPDVIATSGSAKVGVGYATEPTAVSVSLDGQAND